MNEFDVIERLFLPLSFNNQGAMGLKDDVAQFNDIIISTDTLVENTHFREEDSSYSIGQKLIRVNVSDIIAKGAIPIACFLNIAWNNVRGNDGLIEFSNGLKDALFECADKMPVLGGDTTKINGPIVISLTIFGEPISQIIKRHNAKANDLICVSGNIGDAKIGLEALTNESREFAYAAAHYQIPKIPKLEFANIISKYANSSLDISDGLLGDTLKLMPDNFHNYEIDFEKIPLSDDVKKYLEFNGNDFENIIKILSFGDDYQTIFTIDEAKKADIIDMANSIGHEIFIIGRITKNDKSILKIKNVEYDITDLKKSYSHNFTA